MVRRVRGDAGQAGVVVLVSLVVVLAVAGLAVDGAALVAGKIGLASDADAAARAGAAALNQSALTRTDQPMLLPGQAEDAARRYAVTVCPSCAVSVTADAGSVNVQLTRTQPAFFLEVVGIRSVEIRASSTASPVER